MASSIRVVVQHCYHYMERAVFEESVSEAGQISTTQTVLAKKRDVVPYPGYSSLAPLKNDLRVDPFGPHLSIEARILDKGLRGPVADGAVEIWHKSNDSGEIRHRAKLFTDNKGYIRFTTDIPARQKGKNYEIYFRVIAGGECYYARLTFNRTTLYLRSRHGADNRLNLSKSSLNSSSLRFNLQLSTSSF